MLGSLWQSLQSLGVSLIVLIGVAVSALYLAVFSFQRITGCAVIEIDHSVSTIMAPQAVCTKIPHMVGSKGFFMIGMAVQAGLVINGRISAALMAF